MQKQCSQNIKHAHWQSKWNKLTENNLAGSKKTERRYEQFVQKLSQGNQIMTVQFYWVSQFLKRKVQALGFMKSNTNLLWGNNLHTKIQNSDFTHLFQSFFFEQDGTLKLPTNVLFRVFLWQFDHHVCILLLLLILLHCHVVWQLCFLLKTHNIVQPNKQFRDG